MSSRKSIRFFEANWSYYFGFGFPFALALQLFPPLLSSGVYALLFPIFVCMSVEAEPLVYKRNETLSEKDQATNLVKSEETGNLPSRISMFSLPVKLTEILLVKGLGSLVKLDENDFN